MRRPPPCPLFPYTTLFRSTGLPLTGAVQVATSYATGCVVKGEGTVWCWGSNGSGQHGNGTTASTNRAVQVKDPRSEEHTSELQSRLHLVCRLLLEKKNDDH